MNRNQMLKKYLDNPELGDMVQLSEEQLKKIDLFSGTDDLLISVLQTAINNLEGEDSIDTVARRVNQMFKKVSQ